jgi:hypothetical protein
LVQVAGLAVGMRSVLDGKVAEAAIGLPGAAIDSSWLLVPIRALG